ncbi:MAG TPA: methylmalonyl Co-A mutase-associated GTPase MeaB [Chloroflexota bacterium]|nr:methylmalonyl Co-A mutase-associated GTPase MeaB [Chloroflexota bacterium]
MTTALDASPSSGTGNLALESLAPLILDGSHRAAARAISMIENGDPRADDIVRQLYPHTGHAFTVGFTGPPGAGKSSLVDDIVQLVRGQGCKVGVIAVDPNSPFSGGAILGDRIRMMRHTVDPDVFIRSMGSRGHLGGLALATSRAVQVFDALHMDYVFAETVGVGQSELEVAETADTTVVVLMPGLGDSVQTIKAGIMEIADIFVVNKADHPMVQRTVADLKELLRLDSRPRAWTPPVVRTVATREEGVFELWSAIEKHRRFLEETGEMEARRRRRLEGQIVEIAARQLRERVLGPSSETPEFQRTLGKVVEREIDPFSAASQLVRQSFTAAGEDSREVTA